MIRTKIDIKNREEVITIGLAVAIMKQYPCISRVDLAVADKDCISFDREVWIDSLGDLVTTKECIERKTD